MCQEDYIQIVCVFIVQPDDHLLSENNTNRTNKYLLDHSMHNPRTYKEDIIHHIFGLL